MANRSIRDYGVHIGTLPTGARNAITDVPGVTVGHCTIDTPEHQTGVTVVIPAQHNLFAKKLPAACYTLNGFGKTLGLVQVEELGSLETPIALTNTLNVGIVHDALVEYTLERCRAEGIQARSLNPVVGECNDATLNNIGQRAVTREHVRAAIDSASADFAQGAVGAGRGTICYGLKGGIGSASRKIRISGKDYMVGVLVQSNHGRTEDLTVGGKQIGLQIAAQPSPFPDLPKVEPADLDRGSIMMILGTDLPVSDRQLRRILKRCTVGLVRTGSYLGHGSGDIMIGFSTAYTLPESGPSILQVPMLSESRIELAFRAAAEACEEAILNSLAAADTVIGYQGNVRYAAHPWLNALL